MGLSPEGESLTGGGAPACVLVVEDDPLLRRVVIRLLRGWGYRSLEAPDGGAAVDQVRSSRDRLSVVLLDIMLPVLDGVEVARRVRAERPDLPIVACSAVLNTGVEADLRGLGIRDFLPKPYSAEALRDMLVRTTQAE